MYSGEDCDSELLMALTFRNGACTPINMDGLTMYGMTDWPLFDGPCSYEDDVCDGTMGDAQCVCEVGTVKTQTEMTRRVLAVQGESLYCPKDSCLMEKQGMESGFAGPMDQFYECYGIESGETSEGNPFFSLAFRTKLVKLKSFVSERTTIGNFIQPHKGCVYFSNSSYPPKQIQCF